MLQRRLFVRRARARSRATARRAGRCPSRPPCRPRAGPGSPRASQRCRPPRATRAAAACSHPASPPARPADPGSPTPCQRACSSRCTHGLLRESTTHTTQCTRSSDTPTSAVSPTALIQVEVRRKPTRSLWEFIGISARQCSC